jgi:hypothetical protein
MGIMAGLSETIARHVTDPATRAAIAEELRRLQVR